jgi:DNA-directed RNA polymerase subunit M/transcription elongation factor TFIIS
MSLRKIVNVESFRANIRKELDKILENEKNSSNLEKGIFNFTLKEADYRKIIKKWDNKYFVQIYVDRLRSILNNLKGEILDHVKDGSLKPHVVAFMTHQEFCHDKWSSLIEIKAKRDKTKFEVDMSAGTDLITCRKCKGNKCTFYFQQVRSADEPMTCFLSCLICGNRWKTN